MGILAARLSRVHPHAKVARDVQIGQGCVIGPDVEIGRGTQVLGRVCLTGTVRIGEFNRIGPFVGARGRGPCALDSAIPKTAAGTELPR